MPLSALEVLEGGCCVLLLPGCRLYIYIYGCVVHVYVNSFVKVALALLCDHEGTLKYREYKLYIHVLLFACICKKNGYNNVGTWPPKHTWKIKEQFSM